MTKRNIYMGQWINDFKNQNKVTILATVTYRKMFIAYPVFPVFITSWSQTLFNAQTNWGFMFEHKLNYFSQKQQE